MDFGKELRKAMIDCNVGGAAALSEKAEMSYNKVTRALNSDGSSRLVDIVKLAEVLNLQIKFVKLEVKS